MQEDSASFSQIATRRPITSNASLEEAIMQRDARMFRILNIDMARFRAAVLGPNDLSLERFLRTAISLAPKHQDVSTYSMGDCVLSCVNWKGRHFITGTDIVRYLTYRYEQYTQSPPHSAKKFEEGVFSDLRRLQPPKDAALESTRSDFLVFLFNYDCVRSKKKQKVFFWKSFLKCHNSLFCDALERELARREMARAVGLTVEEFIKSGLVPTGTSTNLQCTNIAQPGAYDWTVTALADVLGSEKVERPHPTMEQVTLIRNDIASLFTRHLRSPLGNVSDTFEPELEMKIVEFLNSRLGKGEIAIKRRTRAAGGCDDDDDSGEEKRSTKRKKTMMGRGRKKQTVEVGDEHGLHYNMEARNYHALKLSPSTRSKITTEALSYPQDDQFSVSTLSSDEEDNRFSAFPNLGYNIPVPIPFVGAPSTTSLSAPYRKYIPETNEWLILDPASSVTNPSQPVTPLSSALNSPTLNGAILEYAMDHGAVLPGLVCETLVTSPPTPSKNVFDLQQMEKKAVNGENMYEAANILFGFKKPADN